MFVHIYCPVLPCCANGSDEGSKEEKAAANGGGRHATEKTAVGVKGDEVKEGGDEVITECVLGIFFFKNSGGPNQRRKRQ